MRNQEKIDSNDLPPNLHVRIFFRSIEDVFIVSHSRTPLGSFQGALKVIITRCVDPDLDPFDTYNFASWIRIRFRKQNSLKFGPGSGSVSTIHGSTSLIVPLEKISES